MATVISVHGTFAQGCDEEHETSPSKPAWWKPDSAFEHHVRQFIVSRDGSDVSFLSYNWSGNNSELDRRDAGTGLLALFRDLEEREEEYCVIGHSHGGSVIASALLESVADDTKLVGLQRWITVGTPFVTFRKERFLFSRLPITLKALFVAVMMLGLIFFVYASGEVYSGRKAITNPSDLWRLALPAIVTALPFWGFYFYSWFTVSNRLRFYHPKTMQTARKRFEHKWLSLCHKDDEAVQGLKSLSSAKINIFPRKFAVPVLNLASLATLPLLFTFLIFSPNLMVEFVEILKKNRYGITLLEDVDRKYIEGQVLSRELDRAITDARGNITDLNQEIQNVDQQLQQAVPDADLEKELRAYRKLLDGERVVESKQRDQFVAKKRISGQVPPPSKSQLTPAAYRAERFRRRFLQIRGRPCDGGRLCHSGRDVGLNAGVLFHLLTDEFSSMLVYEDVRDSAFGQFFLYALPVVAVQIVVVPVVFAIFSIAMVVLFRILATGVSYVASHLLDNLTWAQIRRSALGNDTESEIALSASRNPVWIPGPARCCLPEHVAQPITEHSNKAMISSLNKIREAIGDLAFADCDNTSSGRDGHDSKTDTISKYLNWDELIHTSYFEVLVFRDLIAVALSQMDGFAPVPALRNDPQLQNVIAWLQIVRSPEGQETN